ncbi:hypothetical protein YC2023_059637 [Brassica napus]
MGIELLFIDSKLITIQAFIPKHFFPRRIRFDPICSLRGNEKGKLRQIKGGSMGDVQLKKRGYIWAISAGFNAALAAISAKFFSSLVLKYGLVVLCNVVMWGCYVNSLRALSSLQATVTNFAANFLSSGFAGLFLFHESLSFRWFAGALSITIGVVILSKSSVDKKVSTD